MATKSSTNSTVRATKSSTRSSATRSSANEKGCGCNYNGECAKRQRANKSIESGAETNSRSRTTRTCSKATKNSTTSRTRNSATKSRAK